jgi:hypothetical protein
MNTIECELARDFIRRDFAGVLIESGFRNVKKQLYAWGKIRLLSAAK